MFTLGGCGSNDMQVAEPVHCSGPLCLPGATMAQLDPAGAAGRGEVRFPRPFLLVHAGPWRSKCFPELLWVTCSLDHPVPG